MRKYHCKNGKYIVFDSLCLIATPMHNINNHYTVLVSIRMWCLMQWTCYYTNQKRKDLQLKPVKNIKIIVIYNKQLNVKSVTQLAPWDF